ncbi:MAG: Gfo/Idh/MocA family protein [Sphingomonadaceae bacterium]
MTKPLKVGIISANWSLKVHGAAWRRIEGVELAAICTAHQETAEKAASEYGIPKAYWNHEEMSADPEINIIDIGTRPSFRFPMVMAALKNGKHVYSALPFAVSLSETETMRDAQLEAGTVCSVDAQFRWIPEAQKMKAMIDDGFIGQPLGFNMQLMLPLVEENGKPYAFSAWSGSTDPYYWLADRKSGGSAWRNFATHSMLFLTHLLGPVKEATGMLTTGVPEWFLPNGDILFPETHDLGSAAVRLENGAIGSVQAGWCVPDTEGWRVEIWGTKGRLLLTDTSFGNAPGAELYAGDASLQPYGQRSCHRVEIEPDWYDVPNCPMPDNSPRPFVAYDWMFSNMVRAIREGGDGAPGFSDAAHVHRFVEAVEKADKERRWIRMDEMG